MTNTFNQELSEKKVELKQLNENIAICCFKVPFGWCKKCGLLWKNLSIPITCEL